MSTLISTPKKNIGLRHNVTIRVLDAATHEIVAVHTGHNAATNSMLVGIAHYLTGDGVLNQGHDMLSQYVPRYISLGTMGLINQDATEDGYPAGVGTTEGMSEEDRYCEYMRKVPGYGADGYDYYENNGREFFGLGPQFNKTLLVPVNCELTSDSVPRTSIAYREIVPESEAEYPQTIDVIYSAMVSTGALAQFRAPGKDYIFITEAGLWASNTWSDSGENGLLAGYRIAPTDEGNWDMRIPDNRRLLDKEILRVGKNQVVQIIWKVQIGSVAQLIQREDDNGVYWYYMTEEEIGQIVYWNAL